MADPDVNELPISDDASLLIVDDEVNLRLQLAKAMDRRGFQTDVAESVAEGIRAVEARPPKYAVIDLRLNDGSGLDVVETLRRVRPDARIVVLTGYGNIATAVAAVKAGWIICPSLPMRIRSPQHCWPTDRHCRRRRTGRCRRTGCAGSISNACMSNAIATSPRRRVA